jgi:hypothetical protein
MKGRTKENMGRRKLKVLGCRRQKEERKNKKRYNSRKQN